MFMNLVNIFIIHQIQRLVVFRIMSNTLLEGLENCTKPAKVYRKLSKTLPKPIYNDISLKQVQQAMGYLKKNVCSVLEQNTIGFLYEWLQTHELGLDSDIHTAGILPGWVCQGSSNLEGTEANVQFVLTTKRILCNLVKQAEYSSVPLANSSALITHMVFWMLVIR